MFQRVLGLAATLALVAYVGNKLTLEIELENDKQQAEKQAEVKAIKKAEIANNKKATRAPASVKDISTAERGTKLVAVERDDQPMGPENKEQETPSDDGSDTSTGAPATAYHDPADHGGQGSHAGSTPKAQGQAPTGSRAPSSVPNATSPGSRVSYNNTYNGNAGGGSISISGSAPYVPKKVVVVDPNPHTNPTVRTESTPECTADVGSGSFSAPISVALSCSTSASIKYCLSENTCCDPSAGSTYTGPITVGEHVRSYCLSFAGTTTSGKSSTTSQKSYTFSADLPDLKVTHPKLYYQTTQLRALLQMGSDDFGGTTFSAGVINMRTHDPGPSSLNMTCAEIVAHHTQLNSPSTAPVLTDKDVSLYSPSTQLNIFFTQPELQYGNNYLTTYLKNTLFADLVSCSTTNIILQDFPYFDAQIAHGETGSNAVREFSGGFTSVGFFEAQASVYRGPAGSSSQDVSDQELRSGLFGVFY